MPTIRLSQTYLYGGKHYGPGEVDIESADVAKALSERDAGILAARQPQRREANPAPAEAAKPRARGRA